jgi:hypothetical protein
MAFTRETFAAAQAAALQDEIAGEQASALGRTEREMTKALIALREGAELGAARRAALLKDAAHATWCYFVQREVHGMRNHRAIIAEHAIPREVLARLGAR